MVMYMKVNMYDFDKTIYDGDSSVDFFKFCFMKGYIKFSNLLSIVGASIRYVSGVIDITHFKEIVFGFLSNIDDIDEAINEFWDKNRCKIKKFYLDKKHEKDIINSAGPYFLLEPICRELDVFGLIASDVDKLSGKFNSVNNSKDVKVINFKEKYPKYKVMDVYSDSMNDSYILDMGINSFVVKGNEIIPYKEYKVGFVKKTLKFVWNFYRNHLEIINYLFVGGCTTLVSILSFMLCRSFKLDLVLSNIISWILSVIFAYFTNRIFVFKSDSSNWKKEFITFSGGRVVTLILDTLLMIIFVNYLYFNDLISKIVVQLCVLVSNYIISKLFVFRK